MGATKENGVLLAQYHEGKRKTVAVRLGDDWALGISSEQPELVEALLGAAIGLYNRKGEVHVKHKGIVLFLSDSSPRVAVLRSRTTRGFAVGRSGMWLACEMLHQPLSQNAYVGRLEVNRAAYLAHQYRQRSLEESLGREAAYRYVRQFIVEAVLVRDIIQQENDHE